MSTEGTAVMNKPNETKWLVKLFVGEADNAIIENAKRSDSSGQPRPPLSAITA